LAAFSKGCSSISDLNSIAKALDLTTFTSSASFKETYRNLAKSIFLECNLSFAIVEGLHRLYTIRNILEGRFCEASEEPYAKNIFLQAKVKLRLHILDVFETDVIKKFQELSLFIMKVKQASLQRTMFDEIMQISNLMSGILDLDKINFLEQAGRHDSITGNYLYDQRVYVYKAILEFALNEKTSYVLYSMQVEHINSVLHRQLIQNKHAFLGLDDSVDLKSNDLFHVVKTVVEKNMKEKASDYIILCTKDSTRNMDNLTKPLSQNIRVVMSYFTLASINIEMIKRAVRIFCSSNTFKYEQSKMEVDIMHTMFRMVVTISSFIEIFKKSVRLTAADIHSSKVTQLLSMNLFADVLSCMEEIGHNPCMPQSYMGALPESDESQGADTIFIQLLKAWHDKCTADIMTRREDVTDNWKNDLLNIAKGTTLSKTDIRSGKFAGTFNQYSIPKEILFSSFYSSIGSVEQTIEPVDKEKSPRDVVSVLDEVLIDDSSGDDKLYVPDNEDEEIVASEQNTQDDIVPLRISPRKRQASLFDDDDRKPRKKGEVEIKQKAHKITKKDLKVSDEVFTIYKTVQSKSCESLPVEYEISAIKNAWIATANDIKSTEDLMNIWAIHKKFLFQYYATSSVMSKDGNN